MGWKVHSIPIFEDNYVYLVESGDQVAVLDPGDAEPVLQKLKELGKNLDLIFLTHHHWDHVDGIPKLVENYDCPVVGPEYDSHRIPNMTSTLLEGAEFSIGEAKAEIFFLPGHTLGHIAYYFKEQKTLFCGDTLFSLGCGRLFEGTPEQMYDSLNRLKELPDDTLVYCTHEYTEDNARFALEVDPDNTNLQAKVDKIINLRGAGESSLPTTIGEEKLANPFLLAKNAADFADLRRKKDNF